jgi:hypothetical protein
MNRNTAAWLSMVTAVALHVADEAITGFLPFYNDLVLRLRDNLGYFPAPTFEFSVWLGGLGIAVTLGYVLTPLVARGGRVIRIITTALGILMVANALGHMLGSVYLDRILPGFWSSPLLLAAASWYSILGLTGSWPESGNTRMKDRG